MLLWFLLGGVILLTLIWGLRAFERASVKDVKTLAAWIAAIGGLLLALLLILTGRGGLALSALLLFGPLIWQRWQAGRIETGRPFFGAGAWPPRANTAMTRDEAYDVLGLRPGASEQEIRAAHRRLMRGAHPDGGGSDWLASRVNQARDVLLGPRGRA
jgi:hypothetical protein